MRVDSKLVIIILAPLALSSVTHLWNATGFPDFSHDDGIYIQRAMVVLEGEGPQEKQFYDHPYFGQLFFASVFRMIDYPDSINVQPGDIDSVKALYLVPRLLMGILAVADTFLIYKIAERKYNRKVAFVAAILFAVMPIGWLFRRDYLDPIQLPFILSSVLFATYCGRTTYNAFGSPRSDSKNATLCILISGIFLGLAIFTKFPAVTMIPLVAYLIYKNARDNNSKNRNNHDNNKQKVIRGSLKQLGLWFIPVIIIPAIWPVYALSIGQFDNWSDGMLRQAGEREFKSISDSLTRLFKMDPIFMIISGAGFVYAAIKRDLSILLWIIPFVIFFILVGHVTYNYWVPVLPAFCICAGMLIVDIPNKLTKRKTWRTLMQYGALSAVAIFGLISTFMLVTIDVTSPQFQAMAFATNQIKEENNSNFDDQDEGSEEDDLGVTVVAAACYSWIFKYAYNMDHIFSSLRDSQPIQTERTLLMADRQLERYIESDNISDTFERLRSLYENTETVAEFRVNLDKYDNKKYPYYPLGSVRQGTFVDVRANY